MTTMQAPSKTPGPEFQDVDEQAMDHGLLQEAQSGAYIGTALDDGDMHRMGKVQELKACLLTIIDISPNRFLTFSNREIYDLWLH